MKSLDTSNKLKQIEGIFPQKLTNNLILAKTKKMLNCKILLKDDLNYKSKRAKTYNFSEYSLAIVFLRYIHEGNLSIEKADNKQSNFANELKNFHNCIKALEKSPF